jgi:hypothetical protein
MLHSLYRSMERRAKRTGVCVAALVCVSGCEDIATREARQRVEMVEMARADAVAESTFVQDSVAIAASFHVDTIDGIAIAGVDVYDDEGYRRTEKVFKVTTRKAQVCFVDSTRGALLAFGDTLTCQWEKSP